jgi:hypothetical protein
MPEIELVFATNSDGKSSETRLFFRPEQDSIQKYENSFIRMAYRLSGEWPGRHREGKQRLRKTTENPGHTQDWNSGLSIPQGSWVSPGHR